MRFGTTNKILRFISFIFCILDVMMYMFEDAFFIITHILTFLFFVVLVTYSIFNFTQNEETRKSFNIVWLISEFVFGVLGVVFGVRVSSIMPFAFSIAIICLCIADFIVYLVGNNKPVAQPTAPMTDEEAFERISNWQALLDSGVITQEEFEQARNKYVKEAMDSLK